MNLRILHSSFTLNLVDTSFTMIEENNWFNDSIFSKYTYPVTKKLTDEEDAALQFISDFAARGVQTIYNVIFEALDVEHEAVMEIENITGRTIEFQIRYGFEDFPNFDKKLALLPLHKFVLTGESIYKHAKDKIALGYPDADYNFPQVFTDQFDTETDQWQAFEGRINNYTGTVFVQNDYDTETDVQINRNIMQPLPSLLYVLKTGFLDKGYTLAGDILADPEFKNAFIFSLSEYYSTIKDSQKQEILLKVDEFNGTLPGNSYYFTFYKGIVIDEPGRYKIAGNLYLQSPLDALAWGALNGVFVNGNISIGAVNLGQWTHFGVEEKFVFVDITFEIMPGQAPQLLTFMGLAANYRVVGGTRVYDSSMLDLTVSQLTRYNPDGSAEATLVLANDIDLTRCVPDITFGDLYKSIKQWKNYGVDIQGTTVYMDLVTNKMGKGTVKDLRHTEIKEPPRLPNAGKTFELKFSDISSEIYEFDSIYITNNGVTSSPYVAKEGTEQITIEAVPLPLKSASAILTAHGFLDDKSKLQLVLYNGLTSGMNLTQNPQNLLIPAIYENYYRDWFAFLLKAISYLWTFNDYDLNVRDLRDKTTVFAYAINHVVVKLSKKNVAPGVIQTEIETLSLE